VKNEYQTVENGGMILKKSSGKKTFKIFHPTYLIKTKYV